LIALTLVISNTAGANGRFPEAQTIESVPGSGGATLFLRTTFGILVSRDAGAQWRWICERSLGYDGQWDPPIAASRDGRLWVGLENGLAVTSDGCTALRVAELEGETVKDLTVDATGDAVWAITGAPTKKSFVWRRPAGGSRFERLADLGELNVMTIEVGGPRTVYVTAQPYTTIRGRIYRSDDGGRSFTTDDARPGDAGSEALGTASASSARLAADGPLFLGAVDPSDPRRLLLRHLHGKGSDLYLSRDGGRTLALVLSMKSAMFGFAKSADGKTIWAGSGLPEHGIFRSTDRGEHFERVAEHGVLCLHAAAPNALFACENAATLGAPAVAVARDGVGATLTPLARFTDVEGPLACDAGTALCADVWPNVRASFAPAPAPDSGAASTLPPAPPARRASCGCEAVGSAPASRGMTSILLPGLVLLASVRSLLTRGSRRNQRVLATAPPRPQSHEMAGRSRDGGGGTFADHGSGRLQARVSADFLGPGLVRGRSSASSGQAGVHVASQGNMRLPSLLALSALVVGPALACSVEGGDDLSGVSHLRAGGTSGPPAAGSPQNDDNSDPGNLPSTTNPNASSSPNAPTVAGTSNAMFGLTLANATPTAGLGDQTEIDVNVVPKAGFNGPVAVTVTGLPEGATADPLTISGTTGKLVIKTLATTPVTATTDNVALVVNGTSGSLTATANANFKVLPKLQLTIPMNIDALRAAGTQYRDEWGVAFGQTEQALTTQNGNAIVVTVFNADSKSHIIHGANGFAHGDTGNPIQPNSLEMTNGAPRTRALAVGTNCNGYPHDGQNGAGASFRIKVQAPPN
jgi:hypothetical protein